MAITGIRYPQEAMTQVVQFTQTAAEWGFFGREMVNTSPFPSGQDQASYFTRNRPGTSTHWFKPGGVDNEQDMNEYNQLFFPMHQTRKSFMMSKQDMDKESAWNYIEQLSQDLVFEIQRAENIIIFDGHTTDGATYVDGLTGLTGAAGNTYTATGAAWAAGGDPYTDLQGMINLLVTDSIRGPYTVGIDPVWATYLTNVDGFGNVTSDLIAKGLKGLATPFIEDEALSATYPVILYQKSPLNGRLFIEQDVEARPPTEVQGTSSHWNYNFEHTIGEFFKVTNAICRGTGI